MRKRRGLRRWDGLCFTDGMRRRSLRLAFLCALGAFAPVGAMSFLAPTGCSSGAAAPDASDGDAQEDARAGSPDAGRPTLDAAGDVVTTFHVDGENCTSAFLSVQLLESTATWLLQAELTCPAFGAASISALGKRNQPYPQVCLPAPEAGVRNEPTVSLDVHSFTDGGSYFSTATAGGGCSISGGPAIGADNTPIQFSAKVTNEGGGTHAILGSVAAPP